MAYAKKLDKHITIERLLHMDIEAETAKIFAIGWSLALLTDLNYEQNHTDVGEGEVKAIIAHEIIKLKNTKKADHRYARALLQELVLD